MGSLVPIIFHSGNASGGGRQLHFLDDKELDLDEISAKPLPKIPLQTSLKGL